MRKQENLNLRFLIGKYLKKVKINYAQLVEDCEHSKTIRFYKLNILNS